MTMLSSTAGSMIFSRISACMAEAGKISNLKNHRGNKTMFSSKSRFSLAVVFFLIALGFVFSAALQAFAAGPDWDPIQDLPKFEYNYLNAEILPKIGGNSGSAVQTIPIGVPPGRAGLQPQLSLSFHSSRKNGWVGMGWSLEVGAIQRATRNGLDYEGFRFLVDGAELVPMVDPGEGQFYRAKIEGAFSRYYYHSADQGWEVTGRDGTRYFYGSSLASQQDNVNGVFKWCLDRVVDTNGNEMVFTYIKDQGAIYLNRIEYSGRKNAVQFTTEPRPDVYTMYDTHAPVTCGLRLAKIETFGNGQLAHTYTLTYDQGMVSGRSRLIRFNDNNLPPLEFLYQEGGLIDIAETPVSTETVEMGNEERTKYFADVNGDNRADLIKHNLGADIAIHLANEDGTFGPQVFNEIASFTVEKKFYLFPDINGDGKADVAKYSDSLVYVYLSNGDGTLEGPIETRFEYGLSIEGAAYFADVNGDGKLDLCQRNNGAVHIYLSNGDGTFGTVREDGTFGLPISMVAHAPFDEYIGRNFADVNGDGLADFIWHGGSSCRVMLANTDGTLGPDYIENNLGPVWCDWPELYPIDVNGDGLTDLLRWNCSSDLLVNLSLGDGTFGPMIVTDTRDIGSENRKIYFADMNGDGLQDFIKRNHLVNIFAIHFSKGDGSFEEQGISFEIPQMPGEDGWGDLVDVTGDGVAEIVMHNSYGDYDVYSMKNLDADLLGLVGVAANSSGEDRYINFTKIDYAPSSKYLNRVLPFVVPTVASITKYIATNAEDNSGELTSVTHYDYSGGYYDAEYREFRGFETVTEIRPDNTTITTVYHQDEYFKNRVAQVTVKKPDGTVLQDTLSTWEKWPADDVWGFVRLAGQRTDYYFNPTVFSREDYTYNNTHGGVLTKIISGTDAENVTTSYAYQNYGEWIWRTTRETVTGSASGKVRETYSTYENNTGNHLTQENWLDTGPNPRVTYTYDTYGNVLAMTNARGFTTTAEYDAVMHAFPVRVTSPDTDGVSHVVQFLDYDYRWGKPTRSVDENGNITTYAFDDLGRLVLADYPDGGQMTRAFRDESGAGQSPREVTTFVKETADYTTETHEHYDGLGRKITTFTLGEPDDALQYQWIQTLSFYDELGRNYLNQGPFYNGSTDPVPEERTFYDHLDRPVRVERPDPDYGTISTTFAYSGFDTRATDPDGASKTEVKDYMGRIIEVIEHADPGDQVTTYDYNAAGDLGAVTNHIGNVILISYDTLGRKLAMDDPDLGHWTYTYDLNGNLKTQTDAKAQTVTFDYDELDRMTGKTYSTGEEPVAFVYDDTGISNGIGRLYEVTKGEVRTVFTGYDKMGRVLGETRHIPGMSAATTQYEYDLAGKLTKVDYPNFLAVNYAYTPRTGLLRTVSTISATEPIVGSFYDYRPSGKIGTIKRGYADGGGYLFTDSYTYHPQSDRLEMITTLKAGDPDPLREVEYDYTPAGDIKEIRDLVKARTYTYTYDKLHRLVEEIATGFFPYKPDTTFDYLYDDNAQPHAVKQIDVNGFPSDLFLYDNNGNLFEGPDLTNAETPSLRNIAWNTDNMPVSLTHSQFGTTEFLYDGNGKRVKKITPGGSATYYINRYFEIINGEEVCYIWAGDERIAKFGSSTGMQFFHKDHLGSSAIMTDDNGSQLETTDYFPFGDQRDHSGAAQSNYKFTDQEHDPETGLYNYDARFYDPVIGRFISADSIVPDWYNPASLNRYTYVYNNPLAYFDPSGHNALNRANTWVAEGAGDRQNLYAYESFLKHITLIESQGVNVDNLSDSELDAHYETARKHYDQVTFGYGLALGAKGAKGKTGPGKTPKGVVDPKTIRFTQKSISPKFKDGRKLKSLVDDLKAGKVTANDVPAIRVFQKDGKTFTLDNRRLKAFQEAGVPVRTVKATPKEVANEAWKFTTKNDGLTIKVRGGGL